MLSLPSMNSDHLTVKIEMKVYCFQRTIYFLQLLFRLQSVLHCEQQYFIILLRSHWSTALHPLQTLLDFRFFR